MCAVRVRIGQTFRVTPLCHGHSNGQAALRLSSQGSVQVVDTTCPQAVMTLSGQGWDVGPGSWWGWGAVSKEVIRKGFLEEGLWSYNLEDA